MNEIERSPMASPRAAALLAEIDAGPDLDHMRSDGSWNLLLPMLASHRDAFQHPPEKPGVVSATRHNSHQGAGFS